jgi:hypothetical protein
LVAAAYNNNIGSASTGLFADISRTGASPVPLPPAIYTAAGMLGIVAVGSLIRRKSVAGV